MVLAINKKKSAVQAKEVFPKMGEGGDLNRLSKYVAELR